MKILRYFERFPYNLRTMQSMIILLYILNFWFLILSNFSSKFQQKFKNLFFSSLHAACPTGVILYQERLIPREIYPNLVKIFSYILPKFLIKCLPFNRHLHSFEIWNPKCKLISNFKLTADVLRFQYLSF